MTQTRLTTRLRGAREFLAATPTSSARPHTDETNDQTAAVRNAQ